MKLQKRIERIVSLTVDDFYSSGKSTNESTKSLKSWLCDELMQNEDIEDLYTYQITILILDKLKSLDIVDLGFIIELMADDIQPSEVSITFSEVVL